MVSDGSTSFGQSLAYFTLLSLDGGSTKDSVVSLRFHTCLSTIHVLLLDESRNYFFVKSSGITNDLDRLPSYYQALWTYSSIAVSHPLHAVHEINWLPVSFYLPILTRAT
jgi:hypothetical protein